MGNPEEKTKHSKRLRQKKVARVRSVIAKELITSGKYKQRIVKAKNGKKYNLTTLSHRDFVKAIQENDSE